MNQTEIKAVRRLRRRRSVRRRLHASGPVVRLSIHRSVKHIYAQIVDEASGRTVCGCGTSAKRFAGELAGKTKTDQATFIGREIARLAKEKGLGRVVFDRGHCRFHGRVKALAEAAREGGLEF